MVNGNYAMRSFPCGFMETKVFKIALFRCKQKWSVTDKCRNK